MSFKKEYIVLFFSFIVIGVIGFVLIKNTEVQPKQVTEVQRDQPTAILGTTRIAIEIANTHEARVKGLSGRASLDRSKGLLFAFDTVDTHCIHMKEMNFPIDILWLRDNGVVSQLAEKVAPSTYPEKFCPKETGRYVLELAEGVASENGILPGSTVQIVR